MYNVIVVIFGIIGQENQSRLRFIRKMNMRKLGTT